MAEEVTPMVVSAGPKYADEDYALVGLPSENAMKALKSFCKNLVGTPFLPKSLVKDQNADQQAGTLLAVCLTGREMGFSPMQSLRVFWLSPDGRLGMYVDGMFALILKSGAELIWERLDNEGAVLRVKRGKNQYVSEFTVEDAKRAGLWTKDKSVWPKYPRAMCRSRVGGDAFRTLFADLGGSQMYTKEELEDMDEAQLYNREVEADKAAEANPALKLEPKAIDAPKAENVIVLPPKKKVVETAPVLSPQEARNEAFLKEHPVPETKVKKPEPKPVSVETTAPFVETKAENGETITEDDMPQVNTPVDPKVEFSAKLNAFCKKYNAAPGHFSKLCQVAFDGEAGALKDINRLTTLLDLLDEMLGSMNPKDLSAALKVYASDPKQFITNMKTAANPQPEPEPEAKHSDNPLFGLLPESWSEETMDAALKAMQARNLPQDKFLNSIVKGFQVGQMIDPEAQVFFRLFYHYADATFLLRSAQNRKPTPLTMREALEIVEEKLGGPLGYTTKTADATRAIVDATTEIRA